MYLRTLSVFKASRALIFAICMPLSMGCAVILSIFLLRQWNDFDLVSRILVVVLTAVHSLGAILLYLMIVVQFRIWLDAARVFIYLSFVLCGALLFLCNRARLPCSSHGIGNICSQSTLLVVIASFVISGLLSIYSVGLAIIAHVIPRPLLAKAPSDIIGEDLTSVNSRTSLIPSANKSEAQAFSRDDYHSSFTYMDRPVHSLARHAPRPLNFTSRPERAALPPAFNYTVTSSPTTTSSLSTPMSSEMGYKAPGEPMYSRESPPSAYFSRPTTPLLRSPLFPTGNSLRIGYPERPSMIPSMRLIPARISHNGDAVVHGIRQESQFPLTRTQSAPPNLEVASQTLPPLHPLPNPFEDSVSRTVTPSTLSSTSAWLPTGSPNLSLSFGSRDFPLPPSYNGTLWTQYTDNYLKSSSNRSQTPPSTPRSLMPGVHVEVKRSSPLVVVPRRPLSFGSIAASLHSTSLPSLPTPAARLPPHPRLQAHLELVSSQEAAAGSRNWVVAMDPIGTTPTSAKTFRSQLLPTDIPHWLASHGT